jgi:hypothetical protein
MTVITVRAEAFQQLMISLQIQLTNPKFSDFTIICGASSYKVHKVIITAQSDYFKKAVQFGKEASESSITLQENDAESVKHMITFFYKLDYDIDPLIPSTASSVASTSDLLPSSGRTAKPAQTRGPRNIPPRHLLKRNTWNPSDLLTHIRLYALADKYLIPALRSLTVFKFKQNALANYDDSEFIEAIVAVYHELAEHADDMWDAIVGVVRQNIGIMRREEMKELDAYATLAEKIVEKIAEEGEGVMSGESNESPYH